MKKFVAFFVVLAVLLVSSCQKSVDKQIIGKWTITGYNVTNINELAEDMTQKLNYPEDMQEQIKQNIESDYKNTFENSELVFNDSTMTMKGDVYKWKYSKDDSKFILKSDDGSESELKVKQAKNGVIIADWIIKNSGINPEISLVMEKQE